MRSSAAVLAAALLGAGCALPLHSAAFLPDDGAAVTAAALHAAVIETFLRGE